MEGSSNSSSNKNDPAGEGGHEDFGVPTVQPTAQTIRPQHPQQNPQPKSSSSVPQASSLRMRPAALFGSATALTTAAAGEGGAAAAAAGGGDSTSTATAAASTLRGFWKKTVDTTATQAQQAWKQRMEMMQQQQNQQQNPSGSAQPILTSPVLAGLGSLIRPASTTAAAASSASSSSRKGGGGSSHKKAPLIQVTELEQASLSPSNNNINNLVDNDLLAGDAASAADLGGNVKLEDPTAAPTPSNDAAVANALGAQEDEKEQEHEANDDAHPGGSILQGRHNHRSNSGTSEDDDNDNDEDDDSDDDDDDETGSYVSSSAYSTSYVSSDAAGKFSALQWAAASVVDSVQSGYFRGRYASSSNSSKNGSRRGLNLMGGGDPSTSSPGASRLLGRGGKSAAAPSSGTGATSAAAAPNQTARILGSSHAQHMRDLLDKLEPHEYIMFLGRGMLGVNLKQSYLLKTGVYVDYLIPQGAAERSRLIQVGDLLTRIADVPVDKQTILTIPQQIAVSKRPLHLVWATGTFPGVDNMNHLEIVVAHMQRWRDDRDAIPRGPPSVHDQGSVSSSPPTSPPRSHAHDASSPGSADAADQSRHDNRHDIPAMGDKDEEKKNDASSGFDDASVTGAADESFASMSPPMVEHPEVAIPSLRSIEDFCSPGIPPLQVREAYHPFATGRNQGFSVMQLCQNAATDDNFRNALQHAFVLCAVDDRRFPFLSRHLGLQEEEDDRPYNSPSALLMLFVEMVGFADLYDVTPEARRLQIANRLAHKFFLPTRLGNELLPPMFDFHQIVPDSTLRTLEASLRSETVHRDLFGDFCNAAMESLSSHPFITFLVSADCARMRAYLRNTSLFVNVPLHRVFDALTSEATDPSAQNYFSYILLYLLCQTDREGYGEYDEQLSTGNGARCKDSAGSLCAAIYIRRKLVPEVRKAQEDDDSRDSALLCWERLWEIFLAPHVGALSLSALSNEASSYLSTLVSELNMIRTTCTDFDSVMSRLCDEALLRTALTLADELIYSYASTIHSKFREHKFHEWLCREFSEARKLNESDDQPNVEDPSPIPRLPDGCVKRLLRRATYPIGVAPHKPFIKVEAEVEETSPATRADQVNAECAVVFGSRVGLFESNTMLMDDSSDPIRRYTSAALCDERHCPKALSLDEIPPTLESYAAIPFSKESSSMPFKEYRDGIWLSSDGWEVSLVTFRIPQGDSSEDSEDAGVYGVSLVFRSLGSSPVDPCSRTELVYDQASHTPVTFTTEPDQTELVQVHAGIQVDTPVFKEKLKSQQQWSDRVFQESWQSSTIGLALLSRWNFVMAMRETLSCFVKAFSSGSRLRCGPLVNLLGTFAHEDVEPCALQAILSGFLARAASPWLERPISSQKEAFEQEAGRHLLQSLPPVPLALMFVTAMLEQKIVIASSRRSILLSASVALSKMLKPLSWCHLSVPRVPAALASDLMQYPAPFILGIASEDPGMMELIRELPEDVTLVDLDVGRVLLAQSFSHVEFGRGTPNNPKTLRALRSQLLYLAQVLGGVFGSVSNPEVWTCDRPLGNDQDDSSRVSPFDKVCGVCRDFLTELLSGTASCSYWIEEASSSSTAVAAQEPTVVFDEDRFFHIKSMRHRHGFQPLYDPHGRASQPSLSVSLSDFELVVEVLMQCQSMNAYIASCDKETMVYAR